MFVSPGSRCVSVGIEVNIWDCYNQSLAGGGLRV